jgi:hypothetical protein
MFAIGFSDEQVEYPYDDATIPAARGFLMLGEHRENFLANLSKWSKVDYEQHWCRELHLLLDGQHKVALIVSFDDPKAAHNMEIWKVYRDSAVVRFQNQLRWYESLPSDFDPWRMSEYIDDHTEFNPEGDRLSEWTVSAADVRSFVGTTETQRR